MKCTRSTARILCAFIWLGATVTTHATQTFGPVNAYTWGISNDTLSIPAGSMITSARLTIHDAAFPQADDTDAAWIHLLDNPSLSLTEYPDASAEDYFNTCGILLRNITSTQISEPCDIIIDLDQVNHPDIQIWPACNPPLLMTLGDSTQTQLSSSILTLMDYCGCGRSFGFGIDCDNFTFTALTLELTIQSFSDSASAQSLTFTIGTPNTAPVMLPVPDQSIMTGQVLSFTITAEDVDNDTLTYSAKNLPEGAQFTDQTFTWTPADTQSGIYSIDFTVSDGIHTDTQSVTITVTPNNTNNPPVLSPIENKTTRENETLTFTLSASDPDNNPLTFTAADLPAEAVFYGQTFSWAPTYEQAGQYDIIFTVTDGSLDDSRTVHITVDNINRSPVLGTIQDQTVNTGETLTLAAAVNDPDGDSINLTAQNLPSGAVFENGTFTWTPALDQAGTRQITLTAEDALGGTDSITFRITVMAKSEWTQLAYDDFESGWGSYTDGGKDCAIYTSGRFAHQGSCAANIQDDSGTNSSFYLTNGIDLVTPGYTEVKIEFWFLPVSMDTSREAFRLELWNGSKWITARNWYAEIDFQNNDFCFINLTIPDTAVNFSNNMKIRFTCDASGNYDDIYIDEITISAK